MGENVLENKQIINTPLFGDLLDSLPNVYKIKGITVYVERELKNDGKNCVDNLIEMIERKKEFKNNELKEFAE